MTALGIDRYHYDGAATAACISGLRAENGVTAWWARRPAEWCGKTGGYKLTPKPESTAWLVVRVDFDAPLRHERTDRDITMIIVNGWFYEYEVPTRGPVFICHEFGNTGTHPAEDFSLVKVEFCEGRRGLHCVIVRTSTRVEDARDAAATEVEDARRRMAALAVGGGAGGAGGGVVAAAAEEALTDGPEEHVDEDAPPACVVCNTAVVRRSDCLAGCGHWYHVSCAMAGENDNCAACGFPAERAFARHCAGL